jgi:hypothetical protein
MTELDLSNKGLQVAGAIIVAAWISHRDKGALLSLNLSGNRLVPMVLPVGWTKGYDDSYDDEFTHTDGRKQGTDPSQPDFTGVIALANVIPDMRALLSLDISSNCLRVEGTKLLAKALESNQTMTSLNISSSIMTHDGKAYGDMSGVAALADVIPSMGALIKLDISSNVIGAEQEGDLQRICMASDIELAK